MNRILICALMASTMCLAACDRLRGDAKPDAKPTATKAAAKPAPKKNVNQPVEDAMMQIPPQMRETYQAAFKCEVERNKAKPDAKAINVTAEYVRNLVARLKDDPKLAKC